MDYENIQFFVWHMDHIYIEYIDFSSIYIFSLNCSIIYHLVTAVYVNHIDISDTII